MKSPLIALSTVAGLASAFPALDPEVVARAAPIYRRQTFKDDPLGFSKSEGNCGPTPCLTFDPKTQFVSTSGQWQYIAPAASDIRGPCPGLNAAANHGYLPRNGLATIEQTIAGMGAAYGMGAGLAAFLSAYAIAIDGNVLATQWSIGGPLPGDPLAGSLIGNGSGISYSHNNYEGDGSICRDDAYTNNGDAHSLNMDKFEKVYAVGGSEDRYTLDKFRQRFASVQNEAIATNPYYFTGAVFSTFLVVPAAYNFVINFMSNHSAAEPSGYLDGNMFKQFFAVTGEPGNFQWQRGQERIPENWYRRPLTNPYNIPDVVEDLLIGYLSYPESIKLGGNTGKVNTFTGVNLEDFTGGVFNVKTLSQGDNFACFVTQLAAQGIPDALNPAINGISKLVSLVTDKLAPYTKTLSCPKLAKFDYTIWEPFPGYKYSPTGPATNY